MSSPWGPRGPSRRPAAGALSFPFAVGSARLTTVAESEPQERPPSMQDEPRSLGGGQPCPEEPGVPAALVGLPSHLCTTCGVTWELTSRGPGPWGPGVENSESRPCLSCKGLGSRQTWGP